MFEKRNCRFRKEASSEAESELSQFRSLYASIVRLACASSRGVVTTCLRLSRPMLSTRASHHVTTYLSRPQELLQPPQPPPHVRLYLATHLIKALALADSHVIIVRVA